MRRQVKKIPAYLSRKRVLLSVLIFSMVLLGSAIYRFAKQNKWLENEFATQIQNSRLNEKIAEMSLYIKNAESAVRGYAISGNPKFVENFEATIDSIRVTYVHIQLLQNRKKAAADAALFLQSDSLIYKKIAFMQRVKSHCDNKDCKAALALISTSGVLSLSDSITKINTRISVNLQAQIKNSQQNFQKTKKRNNVLAYTGIGASILLIMFVFYFLLVEIRKARKLSEELRVRKENYRETLNSLAEGLITTDKEGQVIFMNPSAEQLTGWSWQEAKNQPLHKVFNVVNEATGRPVEDIVSRILKGRKKIEWENNTILKVKNAGTFIISNTGSPIFDMHGIISGVVLVFNDITEKYKIDKELKESEKQLRDLIQNLPEAVYTCDVSGYIQLFNKAAVELWGREPITGKDVWCGSWKIFNTDGTDLPLDSCPMALALKEGRPVYGREILVQRPDGTMRYILPYPSPIFNTEGELTGAINMLIDITDKKEREILIHKNEEKYLTIFNNSLDGIMLSSPDGKIFAANPAACALLGRTEEEICSLGRSAMLNEHTPALQSLLDERKQKGRIQGELTLLKKNGTEFLAEFSSAFFTDVEGNERGVTTFRDITERKMAEKEARDFKYALDESSIVTIADTEGNILYANENFCRISQYTPQELIGQKHRIVNSGYHPDSYFENLWATISDGKIWRGEIRNKAKDGSFYWMASTIVPFLNGGEKPNQYIAIRHDITERKKAEEEVLEINKQLRSLADHLQNVREEERTHIAREIHDELGQQLTVMKMDVSWLHEKLNKSDEATKQRTEELKEMLDKTVVTVRRIASELRPSMLDDMGLNAAIEWHLSEFEKRSGVKTAFDKMETELPLPDAVKTGLFRIVQESLTNVARYAKTKKVSVMLKQKEGQLLLTIKDNGVGFDIEKIAAKKTLGILGMKERTAMIGGIYEISSIPGMGTTVTVKTQFGK